MIHQGLDEVLSHDCLNFYSQSQDNKGLILGNYQGFSLGLGLSLNAPYLLRHYDYIITVNSFFMTYNCNDSTYSTLH